MRRLLWFLLIVVLTGTVLQAQTIKPLWQYNSRDPIIQEPLILADGSIIFATANASAEEPRLNGLTPSGTLAWSIHPGGVVVTPLLHHDGYVYFGNSAQEIRAYSTSGNMFWKTPISVNASTWLAMSGDGLLYFGTGDGYMHALYALSGIEAWKYKAGSAVGPPTIGHDGTIYFAADNYVHAIDAQTHRVKWNYNFFNYSKIPIVMDQYDNLYYTRGSILDVYDFRGNFLWEAYDEIGALLQVEKSAPPIIYGDYVIVTAMGGGDLLALDPLSGAILWRFTTVNSGVNISSLGSAAVDDTGTLYFCDSSGTFNLVDATTGDYLGFMPSMGAGTAVNLMGMDTGWYLPVSDLRGLAVVRTGAGGRSLVSYAVWGGPAWGPWVQWGGTPYHQNRRDDPPDLYMSSPLDGDVISGGVSVLAEASDDFRLANNSLYINNSFMYKTKYAYLSWGCDTGLFEDGPYMFSVIARDSGGNRAIDQAEVFFLNPPPVYGISSSAPVFTWLSNGVDSKYRLDISQDMNFTHILATSATDTQAFRKSTTWQPSYKKWKKVTDAALLSPTVQTTFYWRVVGKTGGQAVRRTFILDKTR